jgi:8-oxo-dGTP diphosphatase
MKVVRAAGGVVSRDGDSGPEIALVHRGRYDDWSLPKGKLARREHPLVAAVREVHEETGVVGVPRLRLPSTRYLTGAPDVEKSVEYWAMDFAGADGFTPNDEVDEVRWIPVRQAASLLTYAHDRGVLAAYAELPAITGVVVLMRHAYAGERSDWSAPDHDRPLTGDGPAVAEALAVVLALFRPTRFVTATPVRCGQTLVPLAAMVGGEVATDPRFDEGHDPADTAAAVRSLAATAPATVVCSQGKLIPPALVELAGRRADVYATAKGGGWVLGFSDADLVGTAYVEPPVV